MTTAQLRSYLYALARAMGDVQAVQKGRVGKRIERRVLGRFFGQILRSITK